MFELSESFPNLKYIDMGSGFKVPYQKGELETDVKALGKKLEKAVTSDSKKKLEKILNCGLNQGNIWFLNLGIFW